jgi:hypothetical protein
MPSKIQFWLVFGMQIYHLATLNLIPTYGKFFSYRAVTITYTHCYILFLAPKLFLYISGA